MLRNFLRNILNQIKEKLRKELFKEATAQVTQRFLLKYNPLNKFLQNLPNSSGQHWTYTDDIKLIDMDNDEDLDIYLPSLNILIYKNNDC